MGSALGLADHKLFTRELCTEPRLEAIEEGYPANVPLVGSLGNLSKHTEDSPTKASEIPWKEKAELFASGHHFGPQQPRNITHQGQQRSELSVLFPDDFSSRKPLKCKDVLGCNSLEKALVRF